MKNFNQIKAGAILSYITIIGGAFLSVFYTPIMLRLLGQAEYGLYTIANSAMAYLGLLSMGMDGAYLRFYSLSRQTPQKLQRFNGMFLAVFAVIALICILCGSVLISAAGSIFGNLSPSEVSTLRILLTILVFNLAFSFVTSVFNAYITANERYIFLKVLLLLKTFISPLFTVPLLMNGFGSVGLVVVSTCLNVISGILSIYYSIKKLGISFKFKFINTSEIKELFTFSFFIFLGMIIDQLNTNVDNFIIGIVWSAEAVAIYGLSLTIINYAQQFSMVISSLFAPRINKMVAQEASDSKISGLFAKVGRIQFALIMLIASGFVVFGRYFVRLMGGEGYSQAYTVILLLLLTLIIPMTQSLGIELQKAKNLHKFRAYMYLIMALARVPLSVLFCKLFYVEGVAVTRAITNVLCTGLIINIYYHKRMGINIITFWKKVLVMLPSMLPAFVFGAVAFSWEYSSLLTFLCTGVVYVAIFAAGMWLFGMNSEEKQMVKNMIKKS